MRTDSARYLFDELKRDDALRLIYCFHNKLIYIPIAKNINEGHILAKTLGRARARRIAKIFGGRNIYVPNLPTLRNYLLLQILMKEKMDIDQIAWFLNITPRRVQQILALPNSVLSNTPLVAAKDKRSELFDNHR